MPVWGWPAHTALSEPLLACHAHIKAPCAITCADRDQPGRSGYLQDPDYTHRRLNTDKKDLVARARPQRDLDQQEIA